jgi:hypothetical protein
MTNNEYGLGNNQYSSELEEKVISRGVDNNTAPSIFTSY